MYDVILVPLDGSDFSESALPLARALAASSGARLHLATVHNPLPPFPEEGADEVEDWAEAYLAEVAGRLAEAGTTDVEGTVLRGIPEVDALEEYREEVGADLVVMSTHGRGPLSRFWLGSMADALLRRPGGPLLLVRPEEGEEGADVGDRAGAEVRRILVLLDGSDVAESVLEDAVDLARVLGSELVLLRVAFHLRRLEEIHFARDLPNGDDLLEEARSEARAYLEGVAERVRSREVEVSVEVGLAENPAPWILQYVEDDGVDLIAMATHGRGGFSRMLLGSVADKVIRGSTIPVFVRRPLEG